MRKKSLGEIFEQSSKMKTKKEKINYIRDNLSPELVECVRLCYGDFEFDLPKGIPPFKSDNFDEPGVLYYEIKKMKKFSKKYYPNMKRSKREQLFIDILASITKEDVKLLCGIKDKKLPYTGFTEKFMREAVPEAFEK